MSTTFMHFLEDGKWVKCPGTFDQIATKVKMQVPVPVHSFKGDPSCNFRQDDFSSGGSTIIIKIGELSTSS
jgi:hypothetical protein